MNVAWDWLWNEYDSCPGGNCIQTNQKMHGKRGYQSLWIRLSIYASISKKICKFPDSKVHLAHIGPTWFLSAPGGPHVGPMNLANWVTHQNHFTDFNTVAADVQRFACHHNISRHLTNQNVMFHTNGPSCSAVFCYIIHSTINSYRGYPAKRAPLARYPRNTKFLIMYAHIIPINMLQWPNQSSTLQHVYRCCRTQCVGIL